MVSAPLIGVKADFSEAFHLLLNIRTWVPKFAFELTADSAVSIVNRAKANLKPHYITGTLENSFSVAMSPRGFSSTILNNATNPRGDPYAQAVEHGAQNPRTGRRNRPVRFMERAVRVFVSQELNSLMDKHLNSIPKK